MIDNIKKTGEEVIKGVFEMIPLSFETINIESAGSSIRFSIRTSDPHLAIGKNEMTLSAINHLVKRIIDKKIDDERLRDISILVDINDHYKGKLDVLKDKAKMMAERARYFKTSIDLDPMSSYERMLVHSLLQEEEDLETESTGDGSNRHIVIKYKN